MISHNNVIELIKQHGWSPIQQTSVLKGEWVKNGSSFYEVFGIQKDYEFKKIMEWLGY